ncbi:tryparedoxin, putative [Trypanosoma brucei gambiense DAL972]|uniref:Tryparedoxin, putative n=1 Tax=Trypanosoma brucei gambiense (strain MHOM/CI/86/DAL972) TaxID=679716 RepID=C9ZKL4_TRYB9|nr:tryparedoxin, putative [Trypanosoma brucei gambiense DAL972]CBH10230.1 tryparedoxin, putative [Trypanosoma brucei gambiense DAL972]|eukprot:XP_011772520.1 tryparedoxin, putative [Trypanosoma brucei gambiense DAL972]
MPSAETLLKDLFGSHTVELLRQDGKMVPATTALEGKKYLLVYFSASWCPPCRVFTPQLATFHELFSAKHNFDVIFVSRDKDESSMSAYFYNPKYSTLSVSGGECSHGDWLALPFTQAQTVGKEIMSRYGLNTIPNILLFDLSTEELVTSEARQLIGSNCRSAEGFPWRGASAPVISFQGLATVFVVFLMLYQFWQSWS